MHTHLTIERMNRISIGKNDRLLSNLAILSTGLLLTGQGQIGNVCTFYAGSYSYVPVYLLQRFWLVCWKADFKS